MSGSYLGIDLGGTNIKAVVVTADDGGLHMANIDSSPTQAEAGPERVAQRLVEVGRSMIDRHGPVERVGLGVPGLFDRQTGAIEIFPNLPGDWKGRVLHDPLSEALDLPVTLINDARAFSLAESTIGAGRGCSTVVCVVLGTGIGGGIVIDGRLHLGAWGVAGEIGHQTIVADGPLCGCGNQGCVESLTKAEVLADLAGQDSAEAVYRAAADGDSASRAAITQVAGYLGIGLANLVTVLGPDRIVIGGGISAAGDLVLDPIRRAVRERVTLVPVDEIEVVTAELGSTAGAVGAALAARDGL